MSFWPLTLPAQATSISGSAGGALQVLLALGLVATAMIVFKPLLTGLMRAMVLVVKPRLSQDERLAQRRMDNVQALYRLSRSMDGVHPTLANELRAIAARD